MGEKCKWLVELVTLLDNIQSFKSLTGEQIHKTWLRVQEVGTSMHNLLFARQSFIVIFLPKPSLCEQGCNRKTFRGRFEEKTLYYNNLAFGLYEH